MSQETVTIIDRCTGQPVEAVLHTDLDRLQLIDSPLTHVGERFRAAAEIETKTPITVGCFLPPPA